MVKNLLARDSPGGSVVKNLPSYLQNQRTQVQVWSLIRGLWSHVSQVPQLERSPWAATKTQHSQKKKKKRIQLPMQEARVPFLVRKDPTWVRATKPANHNYCTTTLGPGTHNYWARTLQLLRPRCPRACALQWEATTMRSPRTTARERLARQWRPSTVINKLFLEKEKICWNYVWRQRLTRLIMVIILQYTQI